MAPNPCQTPVRLLFSVIACVVNYLQVAGFVKATNKHRTHAYGGCSALING
jgi:hypothetical protein